MTKLSIPGAASAGVAPPLSAGGCACVGAAAAVGVAAEPSSVAFCALVPHAASVLKHKIRNTNFHVFNCRIVLPSFGVSWYE
jgi:hypothetical protein